MFDPLYTADEMKAAEAGHDVDELMARAGRAVAEQAMRRFPDARRFVAVCGNGANGGDGRIAMEVLEREGRAARPAKRRAYATPTSSSTRSSEPGSTASRARTRRAGSTR